MAGRARSAAARALVLLAVVAGCGGADEEGRPDDVPPRAAPVQPFPPRAAEPGVAPAAREEPAGRVVRLGGPVEGLAFDGRTGLLAAARQDRPELVLAALPSGQVRSRVRLPASPRHLELAAPGGPVLVPAEEADALTTVELPSGEERTTQVGDHPHDAAFLGGTAFTIDEFGSTITAVRDGRRVRQAPVDAQPGGVVAVRDALAVISVRAYTVELLDPSTLRGTGSQSAGAGPTHVVADRDGRLYITDTRGDALVVFRTRPRLKAVGRVDLAGAPYGIALDEERGRAWVALSRTNELVELSTGDTPAERRRLPTVRQPNSVAVDERTGLVAVGSAREDALQLIGP